MNSAVAPVLAARDLRKHFRRNTGERVVALDGVSFSAGRGSLTALVGPDGAGKTTFIRLACGLLLPDGGELNVLGIDVPRHPQEVQNRISYMPQRFGLYDDLSVQQNLDLYADLHGVTAAARRDQYARLMEMTALAPFTKRLAGQLSGGMKQKLGLACSLVRAPELLLLDEPTAGVDPLSRHELWQIILRLVREQQTTVIISTSYLDEAERCDHAVVLHEGKVLANSAPGEVSRLAARRVFVVAPPPGEPPRILQSNLLDSPMVVDAVPQAGRVRFTTVEADGRPELPADQASRATAPRFEDGFMILLRQTAEPRGRANIALEREITHRPGDVAMEVRDLVRVFGNFTAVDHISFSVRRGELFGLLGPNGAGKTTTFRMLCGLLPVTSGSLRVAGLDLRTARASARAHIGYVAQKFSLYGQLSVAENLGFFASAYGLSGERRERRIAWAMEQFELSRFHNLPSAQLPGGFKQRLAMAAALLHEPEILFLDEPTSGADPLARREFWRRITALAENGVTVVVTTHFMEEAEYCDRIAVLDQGQVLAEGTPAEIRRYAPAREGQEPGMEEAFLAIIQESRRTRPASQRAGA
jgi:ABC-2 type transport system ATP-binding protein